MIKFCAYARCRKLFLFRKNKGGKPRKYCSANHRVYASRAYNTETKGYDYGVQR
jgi:hypothetical protein